MPRDRSISHINNFAHLARSRSWLAASLVTQRHALFALPLVAGVLAGCATTPRSSAGESAADSIDVRDERGTEGTLAGMKGRVVVIDLCASSVAACNVNARILDEALTAFRDQPVELL